MSEKYLRLAHPSMYRYLVQRDYGDVSVAWVSLPARIDGKYTVLIGQGETWVTLREQDLWLVVDAVKELIEKEKEKRLTDSQ